MQPVTAWEVIDKGVTQSWDTRIELEFVMLGERTDLPVTERFSLIRAEELGIIRYRQARETAKRMPLLSN